MTDGNELSVSSKHDILDSLLIVFTSMKLWMYYGSGTVDRIVRGQLVDATAYATAGGCSWRWADASDIRCMMHVQFCALTSCQHFSVWNDWCRGHHLENVTSNMKIQLRQLIHIYLKNNPLKFRPYLIWNDAVLGFFWSGHHNKKNKNNKMRLRDKFVIKKFNN